MLRPSAGCSSIRRRPGPCGLLGTLGSGVYGAVEPGLHTTPDPIRVQAWLAGLVAAGRRYAVMEVSSHALDQGRVNGVALSLIHI